MLTHARLKEVLHYEPQSGVWTWLTGQRKGHIAGTISDGYRKISINRRWYRSARLAWFYMTGDWPDRLVDHQRPGFEHRADDRWENLRLATTGQNNANRVSSTVKGVQQKPSGRWMARIGKDSLGYLGTYDTQAEAHAAYLTAAQQSYGEFAQGGVS